MMGKTPDQVRLWEAAREGDVEALRVQVEARVGVDALDYRGDHKGRTALMHAAASGHLDAVDFLIRASARLDLKDLGTGDLPSGNTALLLSVKNGHVQVAHRLLDAGADPQAKCGGTTVLSQAAFLGDAGLVSRLLSLGVNPNTKTSKHDNVPLQDALLGKHEDVAEMLLNAGADPNLAGPGGDSTALGLAASDGLARTVHLLLDRGANPNTKASHGYTPLMAATLHGRKPIIELLLARGVSVNERNDRGETALDIANTKLHREFDAFGLRMLERNGLNLAGYKRLYQSIRKLLLAAGGKGENELSDKTITNLPHEPQPAKRNNVAPLGAKDFLSFAYQTEPDFALLAIKAPFEEIARRFSDIHNVKERVHNVPLRPAQEFELVDSRFVSIVEVRGGPWGIIFLSVLCIDEEEIRAAVRDAKSLSAFLKTKTIAFIGESTSDAMKYEVFEQGKVLEKAEWTSGCPLKSFESKVRKRPLLEGTGDDFADYLFRSEGIYLPACYCRCENRTSWLAVESASATAITRADFILNPAR